MRSVRPSSLLSAVARVAAIPLATLLWLTLGPVTPAPGQDAAAGAADSASAAESESQLHSNTWFTQAFAHGDAGINVTYMWSRGAKFRAETVVAGHKIVTIVNGSTYYAYDQSGMQGIAIERAPAAIRADAADKRPFGNEIETMLMLGAEKVSDEVYAGQPCEVYQVTDDAGRRVLWVTKDERQLPVRIEIFNRKTGTTKYTDFINWLSGIPVIDEFFEPNPNVDLVRMNLEEYTRETARLGVVGPVPVLYADLLHGRRHQ